MSPGMGDGARHGLGDYFLSLGGGLPGEGHVTAPGSCLGPQSWARRRPPCRLGAWLPVAWPRLSRKSSEKLEASGRV